MIIIEAKEVIEVLERAKKTNNAEYIKMLLNIDVVQQRLAAAANLKGKDKLGKFELDEMKRQLVKYNNYVTTLEVIDLNIDQRMAQFKALLTEDPKKVSEIVKAEFKS
jgi:hypothetical protein